MQRLLCALLYFFALAQQLFAGPVVDQVISPSVVVEAASGGGTGTVIEHRGRLVILTAAHVVSDCYAPRSVTRMDGEGKTILTVDKTVLPVKIRNRNGRAETVRKAKIVWFDAEVDLALLLPESDEGLTSAVILPAEADLEPGEAAWYCGTGGGLKWNLQKTIVNQDCDEWTTVNGGGWYGHSGSGLFVKRDGTFKLAGVVVQLQNGENPKSPIRCVTRAKLKAFLDSYKGKP